MAPLHPELLSLGFVEYGGKHSGCRNGRAGFHSLRKTIIQAYQGTHVSDEWRTLWVMSNRMTCRARLI